MFIHAHRNKGMGQSFKLLAGYLLYAFEVLTIFGESYIVDFRYYHPSLYAPLPAVMTSVEIILINACQV